MSAPRDHAPPAPAVHVHIDRLVLTGVSPRDRETLGAAVREELARLMAERGWPGAPDAPVAAERLDAGSFPHVAGARDAELGARIAGAVHGGLTR